MSGKLFFVDVKEKWKTESKFTRWLFDNIEILSEQVGIVV
jgi:hypothetical protein